MDPITTAIVAGAASGASTVGKRIIVDTDEKLRRKGKVIKGGFAAGRALPIIQATTEDQNIQIDGYRNTVNVNAPNSKR